MKTGIHKGFDFSALGGMPINQDRLKYMQSAYAELSQAFASVVGNNVILSGCIVQGESVSEGWMVINGELVPFMGTTKKQDKIFVQEQTKPLIFGNGETKSVEFSRFAVFGNQVNAVMFNSLKRVDTLIQTSEKAISAYEKTKMIQPRFVGTVDVTGKEEDGIVAANTPNDGVLYALDKTMILAHLVQVTTYPENSNVRTYPLEYVNYMYMNVHSRIWGMDFRYDKSLIKKAESGDNFSYSYYISFAIYSI